MKFKSRSIPFEFIRGSSIHTFVCKYFMLEMTDRQVKNTERVRRSQMGIKWNSERVWIISNVYEGFGVEKYWTIPKKFHTGQAKSCDKSDPRVKQLLLIVRPFANPLFAVVLLKPNAFKLQAVLWVIWFSLSLSLSLGVSVTLKFCCWLKWFCEVSSKSSFYSFAVITVVVVGKPDFLHVFRRNPLFW